MLMSWFIYFVENFNAITWQYSRCYLSLLSTDISISQKAWLQFATNIKNVGQNFKKNKMFNYPFRFQKAIADYQHCVRRNPVGVKFLNTTLFGVGRYGGEQSGGGGRSPVGQRQPGNWFLLTLHEA